VPVASRNRNSWALAQQREVAVARDFDAALRRVRDHVEKARMHERLAQSLQVQLRHGWKPVHQAARSS
jgi:hypothetical protein